MTLYIGVDLHARQQTLSYLNTDDGTTVQVELAYEHDDINSGVRIRRSLLMMSLRWWITSNRRALRFSCGARSAFKLEEKDLLGKDAIAPSAASHCDAATFRSEMPRARLSPLLGVS